MGLMHREGLYIFLQ